jgi:hypothetical protein
MKNKGVVYINKRVAMRPWAAHRHFLDFSLWRYNLASHSLTDLAVGESTVSHKSAWTASGLLRPYLSRYGVEQISGILAACSIVPVHLALVRLPILLASGGHRRTVLEWLVRTIVACVQRHQYKEEEEKEEKEEACMVEGFMRSGEIERFPTSQDHEEDGGGEEVEGGGESSPGRGSTLQFQFA